MNPEKSLVGRINQEPGSKISGNVVFVDFTARARRAEIVGISGLIVSSELLQESKLSNFVEFPKKQRPYNPSAKVERVLDRQGSLVRTRRASRCLSQPEGHSAQECPSGPRHRGRGQTKLRIKSPDNANKEKTERVRIKKVEILSSLVKVSIQKAA